MFCKYCGTQLSDDAKFCTACGQTLAEAPAEPAYQAPQYEAPKYEAPQYEAPQYQAPQYEAPQYQAPQYQAASAPATAPAPAADAGKFPLISLIIGAVSATFGLFSGVAVFPLVMALLGMIPATILGVMGLIRSIKSRDKKGIIMSAIGLGCAFVAFVGAMTGVSMM